MTKKAMKLKYMNKCDNNYTGYPRPTMKIYSKTQGDDTFCSYLQGPQKYTICTSIHQVCNSFQTLCTVKLESSSGYQALLTLSFVYEMHPFIRSVFLERIFSLNSNFMNLNYKALSMYILIMCDRNIISTLCGKCFKMLQIVK